MGRAAVPCCTADSGPGALQPAGAADRLLQTGCCRLAAADKLLQTGCCSQLVLTGCCSLAVFSADTLIRILL